MQIEDVKKRNVNRVALFILLLIFFGPCLPKAEAADPWSKQDIALEAAGFALRMIDMGQTLQIARNPERYHEHNPILGKHPSKEEVIAYFAAASLAHVAVTHYLPAKCRPWFQGISIGISGVCIMNNLSIGLKIGW